MGGDRPAASPWIIALVVSLAAFMEVLDTTITNVSLSHIGGSLAASANESTWVLTSYLVANGIVLPLSGWLSNAIGRKRFFLVCIAGFTAASFACGAAQSLPMLIVFRLIQGLAGGGLQPTQQAIILDAFPPEKRGQVFAITGITMIVAPIIGPTLGGLITDNFSWRWIFYINVPVGLFAMFMVSRLLRDPEHARAQGMGRIDYIGLALVAIGLGCLQIVLDKGQQDDWFQSPLIVTVSAIAISCLSMAVVWLLKQKNPIIELRLLKLRSFGLACVLIFFMGFGLYSSSALLPLLVQSQFGYDATLSGMILSPGGVAVVCLMPIAARLVNRIEARRLIRVGLLLTGAGMLFTSGISPATDHTTFMWMRITQVLGLPFLFIPISTLAFKDVPPLHNNKASALYALARNLGGSVGIAMIATLLVRHTQANQVALAAHVTASSPVVQAALHQRAAALIAHGIPATSATTQAMGGLYAQMLHQASLLAYRDCFQILAAIMAVMAALSLLLPSNTPGARGPAAGGH
jgi:DHA2 family multidrug resistance protein